MEQVWVVLAQMLVLRALRVLELVLAQERVLQLELELELELVLVLVLEVLKESIQATLALGEQKAETTVGVSAVQTAAATETAVCRKAWAVEAVVDLAMSQDQVWDCWMRRSLSFALSLGLGA